VKTRILLLLLSILTISSAQNVDRESGEIRGLVLDATTKEPIFGANVQIVGTSSGAATDIDGLFIIPRVHIGTYSLRITAVSYSPFVRSDVVVSVSKPAELNVQLQESSTPCR
jgi:hypothetical protein